MKVPFETFKVELLTAPCRTDRLTVRQLKRKVKYIFFSDQLLLLKTNKSTRRWFLQSVRGCVSAFIGWSFSEITTLLFPDSYRFQPIFSKWGFFQRVARIKSERKKSWKMKKAKRTGCGICPQFALLFEFIVVLRCHDGFESRGAGKQQTFWPRFSEGSIQVLSSHFSFG